MARGKQKDVQRGAKKLYSESDSHGAASKFGQIIGGAFADVVFSLIANYLSFRYPDYMLLEPEQGKKTIKLEMFGGTFREMDNVIKPRDSDNPVALFESKWLKDARHHNDKGAWILQLREVRKRYPTVRGAVANLAGYWTDSMGVMFWEEGRVKMVLVATDEEVYSTLQEPLDRYLARNALPALPLYAVKIRKSLERPWDLANFLGECKETGEIDTLARRWLEFEQTGKDGKPALGKELIKQAIDELLSPLPEQPKIERVEISLQIQTGNTIYYEFEDAEEAMGFIQEHFQNPERVLDKIKPKKKTSQE